MTVDLDGSWKDAGITLAYAGTIVNSRMCAREALWDNCSRYCTFSSVYFSTLLCVCVWFCIQANTFFGRE